MILSIHPKEYHKQSFSFCGGYSVKAILEAYGVEYQKHPRTLYPKGQQHIALASTPKHWKKIFQNFGLAASIYSANGKSKHEKLEVIKSALADGYPIMLRVKNGYLPNGKYNSILALFINHWITLWGYDDEQKIFYVYDSAVPQKLYAKEIPIGNVERSYQEILRDWKGTFYPWPWKYCYLIITK